MKIKATILRTCTVCLIESKVRKDGAGKNCRSCRAKLNSELNVGRYIDLRDKKFGRLLVLDISYQVKKLYFWRCICDCKEIVVISGSRLRSGKTKSCGCITRSQKGLSDTPTYRSWDAMIQRCYDKKMPSYKTYGNLGTTVCDRWKNSFQYFLQDMGERPIGMTLDRIDCYGNYEPANCRWISQKDQCNNKKNNFIIKAFGKEQTLTQWAHEYGIAWSLLRQRLVRDNWSIEKSLTFKKEKNAKVKK